MFIVSSAVSLWVYSLHTFPNTYLIPFWSLIEKVKNLVLQFDNDTHMIIQQGAINFLFAFSFAESSLNQIAKGAAKKFEQIDRLQKSTCLHAIISVEYTVCILVIVKRQAVQQFLPSRAWPCL